MTNVNKFKLRAALKMVDDLGIEVGDVVSVTWEVDEAYGGGTRGHTGLLNHLDRHSGWFQIHPSNQTPGHFRSSVMARGLTWKKLDPEAGQKVLDDYAAAADAERKAKEKKRKAKPKSGTTDKPVATANPFVAKAKKKSGNPFIDRARS